jgi:Retroviral aspartyl protease
MESATECQYKRLKQSTKFNPYNNVSMAKTKSDTIPAKAQTSPITPKPSLINQRRALGQCFKCGEMYFSGHQCKVKLHMLMGNSDIVVEENSVDNLGNGEEVAPKDTEEAIVSIHATSNNLVSNTMRFKGFIGTIPVFALIDSGSTQSFVNPAVLHTQKHSVISTNSMIVMVSNGERMVTDSKCEVLQFFIQGIEFHHDMRILPVKGYDVILGLDWLSKLGPMRID